MAELRTGVVTFLFTDIEGSTRLLKSLRERYEQVLEEHHRLLEETIARHGGRVVDTQGDSFFAAFSTARDAVLAAVDAQRALVAREWPGGAQVRVRMGIHTGQATASGERYVGLSVHRAARISAAGHGGQILVSQTTHNLLEDEEEDVPGIRLRDLGEQVLKDLDRPVRLYQVVAEGLARDFAPLRTEAPSPAAAPARPWAGRRPILVGALAGVIATAIAIPLFALGGGGSSSGTLGGLGGNAVGMIEPKSAKLKSAVEAPGAPSAVAVGLGYVWIASADANAVYAIDPETNTVRDTIEVGSAPAGIAVGEGSVWVTNSLAGTVSQIAPEGGVVQTIPVGNGPAGVAVGDGFVWVANTTDHTATKIRAGDGRPVKTVAAGLDPSGVAVGAGAVWVTSKSSGTVLKLNSSGTLVDRITVGDGPAALAIGEGAVWVANSLSDTVSKIDPTRGDVVATLEVGGEPNGIAVFGGSVWTANELDGTISRIDPATGRVTTSRLGSRPAGVAAGNGLVYVAVRPTSESRRGGTLTVLIEDHPGTLDPAVGFSVDAWRVLSLTNDGLLTYRRVGGQSGYQLVPNLARSMPTVSEDRKTYTFELRPNIRYSTGRPVRASDFRYSVERVFRIRPRGEEGVNFNFLSIRGAGRCTPRRCDLSKGIIVDDEAGTITYRLAHPDPVFLYKLASTFAEVVPTGTSLHRADLRPVPGTGPYRIASSTSEGIRLVRNPRFREWSNAAQPDGFPDEIVLKAVSSQERRIELVEQGRADLTSSLPQRDFPVPPAFRSRLHTYPTPATFYLVLDPRKPPFDDVRARQAFNYALDRQRVIRLSGQEGRAQPTCQVLPPNFPGYRRYCPYTLDPDDGGWTAPDLARAQQLIRTSGKSGTTVTLWFPPEGRPPVGEYLGALLESLGYRANIKSSFKDLDEYFGALTGGASPPGFWLGWFASYPAASDVIQPLFACGSDANFGHFCDPAIDRNIDRAVNLQARDPAGANKLWAEIDKEITDEAGAVPLFTQYGADFVSKRVGNYQYNPQWGALLSQMWVR